MLFSCPSERITSLVQAAGSCLFAMDISFSTSKLQNLCASGRDLQRRLGTAGAKKTQSHLASMAAAETLAEFRHLPGRCHELEAERAGQLALNLPDGKRLVFEPTAVPPPTKPDGGLDWAAVRSVRILEIADYH
jgi:proteic killer suppression protein